MIVLTKNENSIPPSVILSGIVDESANFETSFGNVGKELDIYCKEVSRINSVGVKLWREFFGAVRAKGTKLRFFDLSPALVSSLNYISDFVAFKEIQSVTAPFLCNNGKCNELSYKTLTIDEAKTMVKGECSISCAKCGGKAELDEISTEYFSFLGL